MKEETPEEFVKNRVADLNAKRGYLFAQSYPDYPSIQQEKNKVEIQRLCSQIEKMLPAIESLIRKIFLKISSITEQTRISAVYLLIGKAYSNLQSALILCRNGKNGEAMELSRSGKEALDLVMLFWEEKNKPLLEKWFGGDIIQNSEARDFQHDYFNKELADRFDGEDQPIKNMLRKNYRIMSIYTHSAYSGLLDSIDVYKLDFDFEHNAGYHYSICNFHIIEDLLIKILLQLKNSFLNLHDNDSFLETDEILKPIIGSLTPEEIKEIFSKHKKPENK